jgi:ABC-type phosphate/phosphonate transport system permease subunit
MAAKLLSEVYAMPIVDRMEFPRRYKLKETVLILVIVAAFVGIWIQRSSIKKVSKQIEISSVSISRFGSGFIELDYNIANKSPKEQNIRLLARVWDAQGEEIASALFDITLQPNNLSQRTKMIDKLNRSLKEGERPYKAEISLYEKRVP